MVSELLSQGTLGFCEMRAWKGIVRTRNDLRAVGVGGKGMYIMRRLARIISERFGVKRLQSV